MFANCSCICILSMPCMQAAPFCKSECYLIVPNGLHFSMNDLHGILTQGDLLSHSQVTSQPTKPWKFDDLMIHDTLSFCAKNRGYLFGYLSKIIKKHRGNPMGRLSHTIRHTHPGPFSNPLPEIFRKSRRLLCQLILQGEAGAGKIGGEHYLQQLRHKSHMFYVLINKMMSHKNMSWIKWCQNMIIYSCMLRKIAAKLPTKIIQQYFL